ncbi:class I mannose-6-phosphate isomerase [Enterococcus faecium]|nr:class I mannose-6-phosphate isomerase [Enterococcus faecium]
MEAMLLQPCGKDYLWGGTNLKHLYNKSIDMTPLAKTWECSVHSDGPSKVKNGCNAGETLRDVLCAHPEFLGEKYRNYGELPILAKFIDAKQDLSIQVHPDDEYARIHENQNGKTEMWYVLHAEEGASLVCGFAYDVNPQILREAIETDKLTKHLQKVSVHAGGCVFNISRDNTCNRFRSNNS